MCNPHPSVLIVDDHPSQRYLFAQISRAFNYDANIVESAHEALRAIAEQEFCLILMDVEMPEMSGLECTRRIRELEKNSAKNVGIPIIAVTAHVFEHHKQECLAAGMNDHLAKPFKMQELKDIVTRWLHVN